MVMFLLVEGASLLIFAFVAPTDQDVFALTGFANLAVRCFIGYFAVLDRSDQRNLSGLAKVGYFILAFIPIGSWFALYYAARRFALSTAFFVLAIVIMATAVLFALPLVEGILVADTQQRNPSIQSNERVTSFPPPTRVPTSRPAVSRVTVAPLCRSPGSVTLLDKGHTIEICGRIIDEGDRPCPNCEYGVYAFLTLEGGFNIISYDWDLSSMVGLCVQVSDKVEQLGQNPVFVYGAGEGYAGSNCVRQGDNLTCSGGTYFREAQSCR